MVHDRIIEVEGRAICIGEGPVNGPPLILFHGVTRRWQTFVPMLPALLARYHVFAVDHPGHGGSDRTTHGYTVADFTRYAEELLKTPPFSTQRECYLYGHSLGAMVVAGLAGRLGDKVKGAILEDPPFDTMGRRLHQTGLPGYFRGLAPFAGWSGSHNELVRQLADLVLPDPVTGRTGRLGDLRDAASLVFMAKSMSRLDPKIFEPILSESWLNGFDWQAELKKATCPLLLLQADAKMGGMLTDDDVARATELNANVSAIRFAETGHLMHWQKTETVLRCLQAFFE